MSGVNEVRFISSSITDHYPKILEMRASNSDIEQLCTVHAIDTHHHAMLGDYTPWYLALRGTN